MHLQILHQFNGDRMKKQVTKKKQGCKRQKNRSILLWVLILLLIFTSRWRQRPQTSSAFTLSCAYLFIYLPLVNFFAVFSYRSLDVMETGCDWVFVVAFQWYFLCCSEHLCMVKPVTPLQAWAGQGAGRPAVLVAAQHGAVNGNSPRACSPL